MGWPTFCGPTDVDLRPWSTCAPLRVGGECACPARSIQDCHERTLLSRVEVS